MYFSRGYIHEFEKNQDHIKEVMDEVFNKNISSAPSNDEYVDNIIKMRVEDFTALGNQFLDINNEDDLELILALSKAEHDIKTILGKRKLRRFFPNEGW